MLRSRFSLYPYAHFDWLVLDMIDRVLLTRTVVILSFRSSVVGRFLGTDSFGLIAFEYETA